MRTGYRPTGGYSTWLRLEAGDRLREEMALVWDTLTDAARNGLISKRARELGFTNTRPTEGQLMEWWSDQPEGTYVCGCGVTGPKTHVQPQHPYFADGLEGVARCADCIAKINRNRRKQ